MGLFTLLDNWYSKIRLSLGYADKAIALDKPTSALDAAAIHIRAYMYMYAQDYAKAIALYEQLIALGYAPAMNDRAYMHQCGLGGPQDYAKAIALYEQAIALGYVNAMYYRALMYQDGLGGPQDYAAAIALYEQAIVLRHPRAMNNRAYMYEYGLGGAQDYAKAIALYEQAIALGDSFAMNNRAYMHEHGMGGTQDYAKAIALYEQAIALGNTSAMNNRAYMHRHGLGGAQDYAKAIALYERAIALGDTDAIHALNDLQKQLKEEKLKADLNEYAGKFEILLGQLQETRNNLEQQAKNNSRYKTISLSITDLCGVLKREMNAFFAKPTASQFAQCDQRCERVINHVVNEAAKHRGWHALPPIVKIILGIVALIMILPALIVSKKYGYTQAFFGKKPKTNTLKKLEAFVTEFNKDKSAFEDQENTVSEELRNDKTIKRELLSTFTLTL